MEPITPAGFRCWWKASEYVLIPEENPTHIAPAPGADLEMYDPFQEYEAFWSQGSKLDTHPPYLRVLQDLDEFDEMDRMDLLVWCEEHGLTGILPHRTLQLIQWPQWTEKSTHETQRIRQLCYYNTRHGIEKTTQYQPLVASLPDEASAEGGDPLTTAQFEEIFKPGVSPTTLRRPGVMYWGNGVVGEGGVFEEYGRFFPTLDENILNLEATLQEAHGDQWIVEVKRKPMEELLDDERDLETYRRLTRREYPVPEGDPTRDHPDSFWRHYAEPISALRTYIHQLRTAIHRWKQGFPDDEDGRWSLRDMNRRIQAISFQITAEGSFEWRFPSLYGAYLFMIARDYTLAEGRHPDTCQVCGGLFVTDNQRQMYCSSKCRSRATSRRSRGQDISDKE